MEELPLESGPAGAGVYVHSRILIPSPLHTVGVSMVTWLKHVLCGLTMGVHTRHSELELLGSTSDVFPKELSSLFLETGSLTDLGAC